MLHQNLEDIDDVLVEGEETAEEMSGSSYASAAEDNATGAAADADDDNDDNGHISELIARREQLAKQVAEQVRIFPCPMS